MPYIAARQAIRAAWTKPVQLRAALLQAVELSTSGPNQSIALQSEIRMARQQLRILTGSPPQLRATRETAAAVAASTLRES